MLVITRVLRNSWMPLTAVTVWGLSFIATKQLLTYLSPLLIITMRLLFAIPFLFGLARYSGKSALLQKKHLLPVILLAGINLVHLGIQVTGINYTSAANTGWIIGTAPLFIAILSRLFLKEPLPMRSIIGIVISLAGLFLLITKGEFSNLSFISSFGDFLVLASCFTWGVYTIVNRKSAADVPPLLSTLYMFICMVLCLIPLTANMQSVETLMRLSYTGWISLAFLGVFCSGLGYVLWAKSLVKYGSVNTAVYLYIEPFITFAGAVAILGEHFSLLTLSSGLIITAGVVVANYQK